MFDYPYLKNEDRPYGALETAMHARTREREMALLAGEYRKEKTAQTKKTAGFLRTLFASLFLS